jgi:hypothetical protein
MNVTGAQSVTQAAMSVSDLRHEKMQVCRFQPKEES